MSNDHSNTRVVIAALAGNLLIALSKFFAAFMSGSIATLAEAIHSVADTANQALLLFGMKRAEKPATTLHPFGHAVESYFWPFMVSILIFALGGLFALVEGVRDLVAILHGEQGGSHHGGVYWSYAVLGTSILFEGMSFRVAFAEFQKLRRGRSLAHVMHERRSHHLAPRPLDEADMLPALRAQRSRSGHDARAAGTNRRKEIPRRLGGELA